MLAEFNQPGIFLFQLIFTQLNGTKYLTCCWS